MNNDLFPVDEMSPDQILWLDRFNARDEKVFDDLYKAMRPPLLTYGKKLLPEYKEDAKDIVQDSFIKVWTGRKQFETIKYLNNYLYTTTRNGCLEFLRSLNKKEAALKEYIGHAETVTSDVDMEKIHTELMRAIAQERAQLSPNADLAIELTIVENKTSTEAAGIMRVSANNARVIKFRAIALIKEKLGKSQRDKNGPALYSLLLLSYFFL